ncbi:MAG: hypothetical protein JNN07_25520 [Verrucomicrobiales bacterium]|nr:hypothetical protein [Verrucomicrobiales bacterium]
MSLIQALLQDAVPMDVYIALRSDGAVGSGTENDPWNGGRAAYPVRTVDAVTVGTITDNAPFIVTITTSVAHGFNSGDIVLMSGFAAPATSPPSPPYGELLNGSFLVTVLADTQFTYKSYYYSEGLYPAPPTGSLSSSGVICQKDPFLFDAVMRRLAQTPTKAVRVHLGPGVFETKGYQFSYRDGGASGLGGLGVTWRAFAGLKMRGSGINVTTLKLVEASFRNAHYHVIGMPPNAYPADVADYFEASDFTIDCNVGGQNSTQLTCGAIFVRGSHTRLRRLRAINFGRQGPGLRTVAGVQTPVTPELFLFPVGGSSLANNAGKYQSSDCVIEECVVEQPGFNCFRESTLLVVSGGNFPSGATAFRNNYINCEYVLNPVRISGVTATDLGGTTTKTMEVTVTTVDPHGLTGNPWVRITGIRVAGSTLDGYNNAYNGAFQVTSITPPYVFKYVAVYVGTFPASTTVVGAWLNRWSSDYVKVLTVSNLHSVTGVDQLIGGTKVYEVTITTDSPHFLIPRGSSTVLPAGCVAVLDGTTPTFSTTPYNLNVPWFVTQVVSNNSFKCQRDFEDPTATPTLTGVANARLGARWQALAGASLLEGNQVYNCTVGGHYIDTWGLKDTVVRNNFFSRVRLGMNVVLDGQGPGASVALPTITFIPPLRSTGTGTDQKWFALFEMVSGFPHFLTVGQGVLITGAKNGTTPLDDLYNLSFKVFAIPTSTRFEIQLDANPGTNNPNNTPTVTWLWTTTGTVYENNVVEMVPSLDTVQSKAFSLEGKITTAVWNNPGWLYARPTYYRHLAFVFRNNTVRYALLPSGLPMTGVPSGEACVTCQRVEKGVVTDNVVDLDWRIASSHETPLLQIESNLFYYFNNFSSSGRFVPGTDRDASNRWEGGVNTVVEEALELAFL